MNDNLQDNLHDNLQDNLHDNVQLLPLSITVCLLVAGCMADAEMSLRSRSDAETAADVPGTSTSSGGPASASAGGAAATGSGTASTSRPGAASARAPLSAQTPSPGKRITRAALVWSSASTFAGETPTVRANERHGSAVTGTDCMSCHGGSGNAPRFAFAGTIAAGTQWTWAPPGYRPPRPPLRAYDDYGYDDYGYSDYGYDDYGYSDYGYDDDDGYGYGDDADGYDGYGGSRKGWPLVRSEASPGAEIRIVGDDGLVFETVTDADGNFWFKSDTAVKAPAFTGLRKGAFTITGRSNGVACGSCHESGTADSPGRIWTWNGALPRT
jgi:hypothetical protein